MQLKLIITNEEPTTIVADFRTFLNYFHGYSPKLTKTKQQLARKDLRIIAKPRSRGKGNGYVVKLSSHSAISRARLKTSSIKEGI